MEKKRSNLSRLFDYAGKFKYLTRSAQVFSAISALMALVPFIYIWLIVKEAIDVAPNFGQAQNLVHNGWMSVAWAVGSMVVYIMGLMCSHISAFRIAANMRIKCMHHIVTLPLGFMDSIGSGKLRKMVNESSAATETYLAHQLPDLAGSVATPLGLLFLMLYFDWRLGLLCLAPGAIAFVILWTAMLGKRLKDAMQDYQSALDRMTNEAVEYVRGIPVLKTFGQSIFSLKRFKSAIDDYGVFVTGYTRSLRFPMMFFTAFINAAFAVLIACALYFTADGVTNDFLLNLIFYIIITPAISVTMLKIMYSSEENMIVEESLQRVDFIMNISPLKEATKPQKPTDNAISYNNVTFRYADAVRDALHNINLTIKAGEHIAFVGPSGGGKTTLASLTARFWDTTSGSIKIGGVNVKDIASTDMTKIVSFVFQDSKLIKGTILENILLAKPDATRDEVTKALHDAQCDDIIAKMPNGLDTYIGTGGVYLSGGEQQRISIARVMLRNTPIIILDEATAFADPDNELKVQQAFSNLSKGKTVIMIAHRLSTVTSADRIFVLKDGEIEESGTHEELIARGSMYARMWGNYSQAAKWKVCSNN